MKDEFYELVFDKVRSHEISSEVAYTLIREYDKQRVNAKEYNEDIAIVGVACRLPEAKNKDIFWQNIKNKKDSVRELPLNRKMDLRKFIDDINSKKFFRAGYLENISNFDNTFFEINPADAVLMDPQQRILLEIAYEALEDAGYNKNSVGKTNTGIFIGNTGSEYVQFISTAIPAAVLGNAETFLSGRISHFLDINGPSMMVNSACSSSLVAVHLACESLKRKETDMMLAGGINIFLVPINEDNDVWNIIGITASEQKCKVFDEDAEGIAKGEGGGIVVLKRLKDAIRDNDYIYAVIRGSAINQDGHSNGLTSPNPLMQAEVIKKAWNSANIDPESIGLFEAHGTGTKLGDPVEINGVNIAFKSYTKKKQFCAIGSSKSNIGHLADGGAGIAALIKCVMAIQNHYIPPTINFNSPSKYINFINSAVYVADRGREWKSDDNRRACVSSFGLSGTNCHMIIEEYKNKLSENCDKKGVLTLSAKNYLSLGLLVDKYVKYLKEHPDWSLYDISYTTNLRKCKFEKKIAIVYETRIELINKLLYISELGVGTYNEKLIFASKDYNNVINNGSYDLDIYVKTAKQYILDEKIEWNNIYPKNAFCVPVPTYAFSKKYFWVGQDDPRESDIVIEESFNDIQIDNKITQKIYKICCKLLKMNTIKINEDLLLHGLQSLKVIELVDEINSEFNVEITVGDIFRNSTIAGITGIIEQTQEHVHSFVKIVDKKPSYSLSSAQKRLFIIDAINDVGTSYNVYGAIKINGKFDKNKFENAINQIIRRHDAFRTYFSIVDDEPVQITLDDIDFNMEYHSKSNDYRDYLDNFIRKFDLSVPPLIRVGLVEIQKNEYIAVFDMHHIISDGTSMGIFIKEFIDLYEERQIDEQLYQYKEFVSWQNSKYYLESVEQQKKYWLIKFSGKLPTLELPYDFDRPMQTSYAGDKIQFEIDVEHFNKVKAFSNGHQVTVYVLFLSVFNVLLSKYSDMEDIIIGSPVAGRTRNEFKNVMGMFVNTLAMRNNPSHSKNFLQFLLEVKDNTLDAFDNQDYQFDDLVTELKIERNNYINPLFSILFVYQNMEIPNIELQDLNIVVYELSNPTSLFDLRFEAREEGEILKFIWEYSSKLFRKQSVLQMKNDFLKILEQVLNNANIKIGDITMSKSKVEVLDTDIENVVFKF